MSVWKRTNKSDRKKPNSPLMYHSSQQVFFNMSQKIADAYDKIILDYMIKKPVVDYKRRKKHKIR